MLKKYISCLIGVLIATSAVLFVLKDKPVQSNLVNPSAQKVGTTIGGFDSDSALACDLDNDKQIFVERVGTVICCYDAQTGEKIDPCPEFKIGDCGEAILNSLVVENLCVKTDTLINFYIGGDECLFDEQNPIPAIGSQVCYTMNNITNDADFQIIPSGGIINIPSLNSSTICWLYDGTNGYPDPFDIHMIIEGQSVYVETVKMPQGECFGGGGDTEINATFNKCLPVCFDDEKNMTVFGEEIYPDDLCNSCENTFDINEYLPQTDFEVLGNFCAYSEKGELIMNVDKCFDKINNTFVFLNSITNTEIDTTLFEIKVCDGSDCVIREVNMCHDSDCDGTADEEFTSEIKICTDGNGKDTREVNYYSDYGTQDEELFTATGDVFPCVDIDEPCEAVCMVCANPPVIIKPTPVKGVIRLIKTVKALAIKQIVRGMAKMEDCEPELLPCVNGEKLELIICGSTITEAYINNELQDLPIDTTNYTRIEDCNATISTEPCQYDRTEKDICVIVEGERCSAQQVITYCDQEPIDTTYIGLETEEFDIIDCSKIGDCCTFFINSNRNGISNPAFYSDFEWGSVTGATWTDFKTAFEFQGGSIYENCPDVACNVKNIELCGLSFKNLPLTYTDENSAKQKIVTSCSQKECVGPANLECIIKRSFNFVYDNGFTPGSSSNTGAIAPNLVRFNWTFTSLGWETGAGVKGIGDQIGPYTGWGNQLNTSTTPLSWSKFGQTYDPYGSLNAFNFYGAPTWRGWSVTGCNPSAKYGSWKLLRDDGIEFTVYPVLYTETIERVYRSHEIDCDGNITTKYWDINSDGQTYTEIETPDDIDCFVSCDYIFEPVILEGAESPCKTSEQILCDRVNPNNSNQDVQFVQLKTDCEGTITIDRYTLASYSTATSPDDFVKYPLVGDVFICGTNDSPAQIPPECNDFVIETLFRLERPLTGTLRNREWHDTEPSLGINATTEDGRNFRLNHDFSLPTTTDNTVSSLALNDTDNTGSELDIQVIEGYITVDKQIDARYSGDSEGYWAVELGECCDELELLAESGGFFGSRQMTFTLPKGIHKVRFWNIDSGGSNSSANFGYSIDGGITYIDDNRPPDIDYSQEKPNEICKKVIVCKDTRLFIDLFTDEVLDKANWYPCPIGCESSNSGSSIELQTLRIID